MYQVPILTLFFICAVTVSSACKVDCRTVRCAAPDCRLGYESYKPPCECCNKCRKIKSPSCNVDCSAVSCAYVECDPGYESYTPPCECCNQCRRIKNPPCEVDCKEPCPLIKCASGYISIKPPCKCCNECQKIETNPGSEVCETIDCKGRPCPIVDCIAGYVPVRSECGCCDKCVKANPGSEVCETIDCKGRPCPIVDCIEGYVPVRSECGCCDKCVKAPSSTCGKNEVYSECGSACPETCANLGKDQICTKQCVKGCFCRKGLVRNEKGECICPKKCPKPPPNTCGKYEVYSECGSACPETCANLGKDQICTRQCVKGCFCRKGLVRNEKGECICPKKCPKHSCKNGDEDSSSNSKSDE